MSAGIIGEAFQLINQELVIDPNRGREWHQTYIGSKDACSSIANAMAAAGHRSIYTEEGGFGRAEVFLGFLEGEGEVETPSDHYELDKDWAFEEIFVHPNVAGVMAENYRVLWALENKSDALAYMRELCNYALEGSKPMEVEALSAEGRTYNSLHDTTKPLMPQETGFSNNGFTFGLLDLYTFLARGGEGFESERCVLIRQRSMSVAFAPRMKLEAITPIYTTEMLIYAFQIPSSIQAQLPATPDADSTPTGTAWAWKLRSSRQRTNWHGKIEEAQEWAFAPFALLNHRLIDSVDDIV